MNVSAAASFQVPYPQTVKANTEKAQSKKVEGFVVDEKRVNLTIEKLRSPIKTGITSEDLDELEKFLEVSGTGSKYSGLRYEIKCHRDLILWAKELRAGDMLHDMEGIYANFKKDLQSKWPGMAKNVIGFTIAEDGRLKVTSPPNTLTPKEEEILNSLLNKTKGLQALTLKHAIAVIELVQLDKPQFEGKVKLDLSNFHTLIDYGLLLSKGALDLRSPDSWLDQLHKKSDQDPSVKKQGLHIEV
ncbi:hypothetical protein D3C76_592110 [compost metagenome]|uniref:Uncharacterized protein n=1 Tax=Pseudomonas fluorescens TaxID=294 RepID=A0A5E7V131_PSEFL|nr:hypothetical protein [Pseudomonas fluorescens]VVQ16140.1 hypothetical protein PS938_04239 [Pseudomonas fluorescens]